MADGAMGNASGSKATPTPPKRGDMLATVFANKSRKSETVDFFGVLVEVRQPLLGEKIALAERAKDLGGQQFVVLEILLNHVFVPGTDELVFEPAHEESLKALPEGRAFRAIIEAYNRVTEVSAEEVDRMVGNLKNPPKGSKS